MRSGDPAGPVTSTSWLMALVVLSGLALGWLVSITSALVALAAVGGVLFLMVFLWRPDVGLLVVLFVRSFTDLSLSNATRIPLGGISASPVNIGLILVLVFAGGVFLLNRGLPLFRFPGGTPFTLLLLIGLVGLARAVKVAHSEGFLYGMENWLRIVSALVVYALAAQVFRSPRQVQSVIVVLAASFVIPAVFGFQQIGGGRFVETGTFAHPVNFGSFLVLILAVFLCQALVHSGTWKLLALSISAASGVLLVATYNRSSWAGALVVLLVIGLLWKRVFLILVPLVAILAVVMVPNISDRLAGSLTTPGGSFLDRVNIWRSTAPEWVSETRDDAGPVSTAVNRLVGTGPGSGQLLVQHSAYGYTNAVHDDYLAVLYEYGVLGLVAYLSMYLAMLISAYRTWRQCTDKRMAAVVLSFLALIPGFMVISLTGITFSQTQNQIYFWTLAGLTVAISRLAVRTEVDSSPHAEVGVAPAPSDRAPVRVSLATPRLS